MKRIMNLYNIKGYIKKVGKSAFSLTYAKYSSIKLMKMMYYSDQVVCLKRKKCKIERTLGIIHR